MNKWMCGLITVSLILCPFSGCTALYATEEGKGQTSLVNEKNIPKFPLMETAVSQQNTADPLNFANENERVKNSLDSTYQEKNGSYLLKQWDMRPEVVPNVVQLQFQPNGGGVQNSDFLIERKTICDGEIVLELMQLDTGDNTFSTQFSDWCPVLKRTTTWQPQGVVKKGETFYGAVWKMDPVTKTVWVDDVTEYGENIGRYESLPYQVVPQLDLNAMPPQMLVYGGIWTIQTDSMGRITAMEPYIYGEYGDEYYEGYDGELTEEEAATILSEFSEVQYYLNLGMSMFFDGDIEVISGETCIVIALGTNHGDNFVRELYYAVSPYGTVYYYDVIMDTWNLLGLG